MIICVVHVRREFVNVDKAQVSAIADEAVRRIAGIYAVEEAARGLPPDKWVEILQTESNAIFQSLDVWLKDQFADISRKIPLVGAIR